MTLSISDLRKVALVDADGIPGFYYDPVSFDDLASLEGAVSCELRIDAIGSAYLAIEGNPLADVVDNLKSGRYVVIRIPVKEEE